MTHGVVYYNRGTKCLVRLAVSVASLRKFYTGPVALLYEAPLEPWAAAIMAGYNVAMVEIPPPDDSRSAIGRKASLWRWTPYDVVLFLDADTLVVRDPSELFQTIAANDFACAQFCGWRSSGGHVRRRIKEWARVADADTIAEALAWGPALNTGIMGWRRGSPFLPAWEDITRRGWEKNCTRRLSDEVAAQVLAPQFDVVAMADCWNVSPKFGTPDGVGIYHYHGNKHAGKYDMCEPWKQAYWDLRNTSQWHEELGHGHGDRALDGYLRKVVRDDVTIVTAVNPEYEDRLRANLPRWLTVPGIREQRIVVFCNRKAGAWLEAYPRITRISWRFPVAGDNIRERMLSAFVFGVAQHVSTAYWLKLDGDSKPTGRAWEWPDMTGIAVCGHRCHYTRTKGQPGATRHFLNQLDTWYDSDMPLFVEEIDVHKRHGHKRFASYCCVERTEHTRKIAAMCGERLPIPSQDTTSWYVAERTGAGWASRNMHRWFRP